MICSLCKTNQALDGLLKDGRPLLACTKCLDIDGLCDVEINGEEYDGVRAVKFDGRLGEPAVLRKAKGAV